MSFDDGRKDFYTNALPIIKKYKMQATLNVVPDYLGKNDMSEFASGNNECVTAQEMQECAESGCVEIAGHSANHTNDIAEIRRGNAFLRDYFEKQGMKCENGFASPNSGVYPGNLNQYSELLKDGAVSYIRSGNNVRRDGLLNAGWYILYSITKSKLAYSIYNRRNVIRIADNKVSDAISKNEYCYPSVTCNAKNTMKQLKRLIDGMPDESAVIIMFHSILNAYDSGYGMDKWYNTVDEFEDFCSYLSAADDIMTVTNATLHHMIKERVHL